MTPPLQDATGRDLIVSERYPGKNGGKMRGKMLILAVFLLSGGVALMSLSSTAAAQTAPTATPIPQVIATQQAADAAAAQVSGLQAERAQTQIRLDEINASIERQIAEATQAAADARAAAAAQNAVESGAAIGRLEGALAQLRESYAGKDNIIADMQTRIETQAAQSAEDRRTIDRTGLELRQAQQDKQNTLNAYNAVKAQQATSAQNDMVSNAILTVAVIALICIILTVIAFVISRRAAPDAPPPPAPIEGEYTVSEDNT